MRQIITMRSNKSPCAGTVPLVFAGGDLMKSWSCTCLEFIPIPLRVSPLAKGGLGGVVPAEHWPGTRVPSCRASRNCRLGRACPLCPVHPP